MMMVNQCRWWLMLFLCSLIFSVLSVSGAAPPWSECSQCLPPTIPCHGALCHYAEDTEPLCWGHRSIGAGPRQETSVHHRLVPGSAHYPPGRRPATVSQQIFFSDISQIFFVFSLASRAERVPASTAPIKYSTFNLSY